MTKPQSPSGTDVLARMIAELDAERIGALSEKELLDEMRDEGLEPERPVDVEKWLAAADEAQRTASQAKPPSVEAKPASVAVLPVRRRSPVALWTSITAVAACFFGLIITRNVLVHWRGDGGQVALHDAAPPPTTTASQGPSVLARVAELRAQAESECNAQSWNRCEQELDEAKALDPAGEKDDRIQILRSTISLGKRQPRRPQSPLPYDSKP